MGSGSSAKSKLYGPPDDPNAEGPQVDDGSPRKESHASSVYAKSDEDHRATHHDDHEDELHRQRSASSSSSKSQPHHHHHHHHHHRTNSKATSGGSKRSSTKPLIHGDCAEHFNSAQSDTGRKVSAHPSFAANCEQAGSKFALLSKHHQEVHDFLLKEIMVHFPCDEYEMTIFGALPRLRPAEHITLQDFELKKQLNGLEGVCVNHDSKLHVWTIHLHEGPMIRVIPPVIQDVLKALGQLTHNGQKPVTGFITYGDDIVEVVLNQEGGTLHRHVHEHIVRPDNRPLTPPQKKEEVEEKKPKPKKKAKTRSKSKAEVEVEEEEPPEEVVRPFLNGDMVIMKDAGGARLGVGKIREVINDHLVKVEFGQRGGAYNLEMAELDHWSRTTTKDNRLADAMAGVGKKH